MTEYWDTLVASNYRDRANQHRPRDPLLLREEIRRLQQQGLTRRDIAGCMCVSPEMVERILEGTA